MSLYTISNGLSWACQKHARLEPTHLVNWARFPLFVWALPFPILENQSLTTVTNRGVHGLGWTKARHDPLQAGLGP